MFLFKREFDFSFLLALLLALGITMLMALILDVFIYSRFQKKKNVSNLVPLIASLGIYTAGTAIISIFFTSQYQSLSDGPARIFTILGGHITLVNVLTIFTAITVSVVLLIVLYHSQYGRALRAIDDDTEVAEITGVPARKIIMKTVAVSALIAGLSGILFGYDTGLLPIMGMAFLLKAVIASIVGGIGNIKGGILGGLILAVAENAAVFLFSTEWRDPTAFLVLIFILLIRPKGLFYRLQ
ncbi:MAG: branched-chain amino acid transport system permease protein [Parcubacteria group bacterium Gr01-1014_24]|nr:MAG: branched-chain amino acid transport system permease protein [Parcubacteria group bacterium Gr01-1014_24]